MISIIGLGSAASKIAALFEKIDNYNVYKLNNLVKKKSKFQFKLKSFEEPEQYEKNIPDLSNFFSDVDQHVQVIIVGSSYSSNHTLGVLQQIKDKKIDLYYIKPDSDLMTGTRKLIDNAVFGVLQEYARSGLFNSFTIISNLEIEKTLDNIPIKRYYESINKSIFSMIHYINFFTHNEPEIGMISKPRSAHLIQTI
jgi:ATP-dependent phosphoenolpyruvate carboxykinase